MSSFRYVWVYINCCWSSLGQFLVKPSKLRFSVEWVSRNLSSVFQNVFTKRRWSTVHVWSVASCTVKQCFKSQVLLVRCRDQVSIRYWWVLGWDVGIGEQLNLIFMRLCWPCTVLLKCINNWQTIWMERNVSTQFMDWSPWLDFALAENYIGSKSQQDAYLAHRLFTHQTTNLLQGCSPCCNVVQIYLLWKLTGYEYSHRPNLTEAFWSSFQTW